jgi:Raf kinase inhibitor-like YbhB/YbcL family protein
MKREKVLALSATVVVAIAVASAPVWAQQQQTPAAKPAAPKTFNITSKAVKDGGKLPQKYAGNNPQNPNCDGQNVSPPLAWSNPPEGTKSYAILMFDPVGRAPLGVVHWIAYDIPAKKMSLAEGEASKASTEFKGGKNLPGTEIYFGPCPPKVDKAHPYVITLMATDLEPGSLRAGMTREELAQALQGKVKGSTSLVARYR